MEGLLKAHIQIIVGSTRPGRKGKAVAEWFYKEAKQRNDITVELIDLKNLDLPLLDEPHHPATGQYEKEHTKAWSSIIKKGDGYIFVTPEYNHGYPASLKNALDYLYNEWGKKPMGIVNYGGAVGGARAAEQLRLVAIELHMHPIREQIQVLNVGQAVAEDGTLNTELVRGDVTAMLDELVWWATTLKPAREAQYVHSRS